MIAFISTLFVLTALLLIGVVLIQQPKTAGGLFSGTGQSLLGTSGKTFWTKATIILASVFMFLCILLWALPKFQNGGSSVAESIEKQQQAAQQAPAQANPQAAQQAPAPESAKPAAASVPAPKEQDAKKK